MKYNKLISFILVVILSFCSVTCVQQVFAASSGISEPVSTDASKGLIDALGVDIINENESLVTRGEFVYALIQLVKCGPVTLSPLPFKDVKEDDFYASSLRYALALQVVSYADSFDGDSAITWAQAAKMLVTALGRNIEASLNGGWPHGYIYVASRAKLGHETSLKNFDDTIDRNELYILLKNFLCSYTYEIDGISGERIKYNGDKTVLELFYGITKIDGIITSNSYTSLYDYTATSSQGYIEIDEITYKYSGECKVGDRVTAYIEEESSDSIADVVYLDSSPTLYLTICADDLINKNNGKLEYVDSEGIEKTINIVQHPAVIYNGKAYPGFDIFSVSGVDSRIEFTDNNKDGNYDVIRVYKADYMYVDSVDTLTEIIIDKNEGFIDLGDDNDIFYTVISNGKSVDISEIKPSSLITYYVSNDKKLYEFYIDYDMVTGVVSEYNSAKDEYIIDGVAYPVSYYFIQHYSNQVALGTKATFLASQGGAIVAISSLKSSDFKYGYLINISMPKGLEENIRAKMLTKDDGIKVFEISKKALLNGTHAASLDEIYALLRAYIDAQDTSVQNHLNADIPKYTLITATSLIRYSASNDGIISMIDTADFTGQLNGNEGLYNRLTQYKYPAEKITGTTKQHLYSDISYIKSTKMLHPYFRIDENAELFVVNIGENMDEEKKYTCADGSYFTTHSKPLTSRFIAYDVDAVGQISAAVLFTGSIGGKLENESPSGIVTSITKAIAPDEEKGIKITLLSDGEYNSYYVTDSDVLKNTILNTGVDIDENNKDMYLNTDATMDDPLIDVGDYIRVACDRNNIVTSIGIEFDASEHKILRKFEHHASEEIDYYYGPVYAKSNGLISIIPSMLDEFESEREIEDRSRYTLNVSGLLATVYDSVTGVVSISLTDEILSYQIAGFGCSNVLIKLDKNGAVSDIVIYK